MIRGMNIKQQEHYLKVYGASKSDKSEEDVIESPPDTEGEEEVPVKGEKDVLSDPDNQGQDKYEGALLKRDIIGTEDDPLLIIPLKAGQTDCIHLKNAASSDDWGMIPGANDLLVKPDEASADIILEGLKDGGSNDEGLLYDDGYIG